jgi:hypothetical protein
MSERPQPPSDAQNQNQNRQDRPQIVVDDPDQFSRTRQLRSIFDARQDFVDVRRESRNLLQRHEITPRQKNQRLFRALQDFVILVQPVLGNSTEGKAVLDEQIFEAEGCCRLTQLPTKAELKEMEIPEQTMRVQKTHQVRKLQQKVGKEQNLFTGVQWTGANSLINETGLLAIPQRNGEVFVTPPRERLLVRVFQSLTSAMGSVGLGVDTSEEQQTKIDEDLLKEVDQWRRQNVQ